MLPGRFEVGQRRRMEARRPAEGSSEPVRDSLCLSYYIRTIFSRRLSLCNMFIPPLKFNDGHGSCIFSMLHIHYTV